MGEHYYFSCLTTSAVRLSFWLRHSAAFRRMVSDGGGCLSRHRSMLGSGEKATSQWDLILMCRRKCMRYSLHLHRVDDGDHGEPKREAGQGYKVGSFSVAKQ